MQLIRYIEISNRDKVIDDFLDAYFIRQMKYLASDLIQEGLRPTEIASAVERAILVSKAANLSIRRHFSPVYTQLNGHIIKDCRLSRIGYGLVLLNARPDHPLVAEWQLNLLIDYLKA